MVGARLGPRRYCPGDDQPPDSGFCIEAVELFIVMGRRRSSTPTRAARHVANMVYCFMARMSLSKYSDANSACRRSVGRRLRRNTVLPGKQKRLFRTGNDTCGRLGKMARMIPLVVANGQVYVVIYRVKPDNGPSKT